MASAAAAAVYRSKAYKNAVKQLIATRPKCAKCALEGFDVWGTQTDHIVPLKDGGHPWKLSNLQRLCDRHHQIKTARENSGSRAKPLTDERGRPLNLA